MPVYHFDVGDSSTGPIGFCARIKGKNRAEALERLKQMLPEAHELKPAEVDPEMEEPEYINVYFNTAYLTEENTDGEGQEDDDEDED